MLRDLVAFVGTGQGGNNAAFELEKLDLNTYYVNTALEDLKCIPTEKKNVKYHIEGSKGMAKDRDLAEETLMDNDNAIKICEAISERYSMAEYVFFIHTAAGGTGGTMGNLLASMYKQLNPDKKVIVVLIKPRKNEDILFQDNAQKCLSQLKEMVESGMIDNAHILTNNSREDKFEVNKDFAMIIDSFISLDEVNETGNMDEEECSRLLGNAGYLSIIEFENEDFETGLKEALDNTIYAEWDKAPYALGVIYGKGQKTDENINITRKLLGFPIVSHDVTWSENNTVIISAGLPYNNDWYNEMGEAAQILIEERNKILKDIEEKTKDKKDNAIDMNSVLGGFTAKKEIPNMITTSSNKPQGRRSRRNTPDMKNALEAMRKLGKK